MRFLLVPGALTRDWRLRRYGIVVCLLGLPGCPLSDDYFIDVSSTPAAAGTSGQGSAITELGGNTALEGAAGGALRGGGAGMEAGGRSGAGTGAGQGGSTFCSRYSCNGTCCGSVCADLNSDPAHCGSCDHACSSGRACASGTCTEGWAATSAAPAEFAGREGAAYAVVAGKLFVFGGRDQNRTDLNSAALYDPVTDTWSLCAIDASTPSPRHLATAVWTGSRVIVYGGLEESTGAALQNGASYDPLGDRWYPITPNPITARVAPIGAASDSAAVFWGGWDAALQPLAQAERYTVATDSWQSVPAGPAEPGALTQPTWAVNSQYLNLFGGLVNGLTKSSRAFRYTLSTNAWTELGAGSSARWAGFAASDATSFYVWGGYDELGARADGMFTQGHYWAAISSAGAPSARWASHRETGWAFSLRSGDFIVLGGWDVSITVLTDGGRYSSQRWTSVPAWPSGEQHLYGAAAYTGGEVVIWGGRDGDRVTATGERFSP